MASDVAAEMAASGALDDIFARIDAGDLELTGDGGFIPGLIKAALERGLQAELSDHLGYEKGSVEASRGRSESTGSLVGKRDARPDGGSEPTIPVPPLPAEALESRLAL